MPTLPRQYSNDIKELIDSMLQVDQSKRPTIEELLDHKAIKLRIARLTNHEKLSSINQHKEDVVLPERQKKSPLTKKPPLTKAPWHKPQLRKQQPPFSGQVGKVKHQQIPCIDHINSPRKIRESNVNFPPIRQKTRSNSRASSKDGRYTPRFSNKNAKLLLRNYSRDNQQICVHNKNVSKKNAFPNFKNYRINSKRLFKKPNPARLMKKKKLKHAKSALEIGLDCVQGNAIKFIDRNYSSKNL